jgi:hypothetical protein
MQRLHSSTGTAACGQQQSSVDEALKPAAQTKPSTLRLLDGQLQHAL